MSVYLDTNILVALLIRDALSERAEAFLREAKPIIVVSDFAATEFAAVIGRRFRDRAVTADAAQLAFLNFDAWAAGRQRVSTTSADVETAGTFVRRLDLSLRAPDALHLAIAGRIGAILGTFDTKMAVCARALGLDVAGV